MRRKPYTETGFTWGLDPSNDYGTLQHVADGRVPRAPSQGPLQGVQSVSGWRDTVEGREGAALQARPVCLRPHPLPKPRALLRDG